MNGRRSNDALIAGAVSLLLFLLGGCASTGQSKALADDETAKAPAVRCPAGYTMVCEAKKVGRIRFGQMGKENLDSCACEPESYGSGRAQQPALPQ